MFKDVLTILIASYGAVLSTLVFVYTWRRERRRIEIVAEELLGGYPPSEDNSFLTIKIWNRSTSNVTVNKPYFLQGQAGTLWQPFDSAPGEFPKTLGEGEIARVSISWKELLKGRYVDIFFKEEKIIRPVCEDTIGNKYVGRELTLNRKSIGR
jgi:hypothetical protein